MSLATAAKAAEDPDGFALIDQVKELTWREVDDIITRGTNALLDRDLGSERRIAVFAENSAEVILAHLAGIMAGASTVPINFHFTVIEVAYILTDSKASVLFVGPETAEVGVKAAAEAGIDTVVAWRTDPALRVTSWTDWLVAARTDEPPTDMRPRPFLHYTSGTTGRPKATETPPTMFAGGDTIAEHIGKVQEQAARQRAMVDQSGSTERPGPSLVVSPLYHTGPLGNVRALAMGTSLVILGRFNAEKTLEAIDKYKVSAGMMVPTHFIRLLALPEDVRKKYDVSSLRQISHTGAACPVEVKRAMIEWFGPILFEAYGATEAGSTNAINSTEWLEHPGSVGKTLPPFELVIVDDDGNPVGQNVVGQIYFRDTTGRGVIYHNDPEKTASVHLEPGVFTLGEMGYVDDEGYLYITDRSSDMVVSGGVNIYPAETEKALIDHPLVLDVACIGVPNADLGEELKALVIPTDASNPPEVKELMAFCRERLAGYKVPKSIEFVSDIGRTTMGKVSKRTLRAPYWPSERTIG